MSNALGISDYALSCRDLGFFNFSILLLLSCLIIVFCHLYFSISFGPIYILNCLSQVLSNFPDNNGSRGIFVSPAVLSIVSVLFIFASFSSLFSKKCLRENDQQLKLQRQPPFHPFAPTREPGGQDCVLRRCPLFMSALHLRRPT